MSPVRDALHRLSDGPSQFIKITKNLLKNG